MNFTAPLSSTIGMARAIKSVSVFLSLLVLMITIGLVTGCSSGGQNTTQSTPPPPPPPAPSLTVTSVSTSSPTPLTPIQIGTTGVSVNSPLLVQFSNSAGFSTSEQPVRVAADGTVIAAVPLYIDPVSNQVTQGTVSLVLSQGGNSSAAVSITIQELPTVASYGTQLGEITRAMLNFEAMTLGKQLNEFQSFQLLPGNKVDTSGAQTTLQNLMLATIKSRNDVDRVFANNSVTISAGALPDGTPIQFDQTSVDMMDRVLGVYLTELAPIILPSSGSPTGSLSGHTTTASQINNRRPELRFGHATSGGRIPRLGQKRPVVSQVRSQAHRGQNASPAASSNIKSLLSFLEGANNVAGIAKAIQDFGKNDATFFDKVLAVAGGVTNLLVLADNGGISKVAKAVSPALGAFTASYGLLKNLGNELGDLAFIMVASRNGADPSVLQEAQNDLNKNAHEAIFNTIEAELSLTDAGAVFGAFSKDVVKAIENGGAGIALQSAELITTILHGASDAEDDAVATAALAAAGEIQSPFSSNTQGFAEITGVANITNDQGPIFAALPGIQLTPLDNGDSFALADPAGNYDMFVTLQATNTNYLDLTLSIVDPVSDATLASEVIDLGGLTTSVDGVEPTLAGTCSDTDASSPDSDDPDCD